MCTYKIIIAQPFCVLRIFLPHFLYLEWESFLRGIFLCYTVKNIAYLVLQIKDVLIDLCDFVIKIM